MAKITIFGLAGTGTTTVGELLAESLGYRFLSSGQVFRGIGDKLGIEFYEFVELCKKSTQYDLQTDQLIEEFGRENNDFVVESRLGYHFIPDSFKVKFICDLETRIKRVADRDKITFTLAKEKTSIRESADEERYRAYYGIEELAPDNKFDLIIDTTYTTPQNNAQEIILKYSESCH